MDIERLINNHAHSLYKMMRRAQFTHEEAQDIVQDVFIKIIEKDSNHVLTSETAYLFKLAKNTMIDAIRKRKTVKKYRESSLDDLESFSSSVHKNLQEGVSYQSFIRTLTSRQREILELFIAGFKQKEIAQELDIRPSTVNYHLRKLRENRLLLSELQLENSLMND